MKLSIFDITNFALMILGVLAFFTIVDGYGGLNLPIKKKKHLREIIIKEVENQIEDTQIIIYYYQHHSYHNKKDNV